MAFFLSLYDPMRFTFVLGNAMQRNVRRLEQVPKGQGAGEVRTVGTWTEGSKPHGPLPGRGQSEGGLEQSSTPCRPNSAFLFLSPVEERGRLGN